MTSSTITARTRVLAIITVAFAGVALSGCSLLGNIPSGDSNGSGTTEGTEAAEGTDTDVFTIKVGDCLNDGAVEGEVSEVKVIDCASEHDSEAFKSIVMDDGDFPGDDAVEEAATTGCTTAFNEFVGLDYDSSVLNFSYFYPTEDSWGEGDREILCTVVDPGVKTTGSLEGAAR